LELIGGTRGSKRNISLICLLSIGASYLASASCKSMDIKDSVSDSDKEYAFHLNEPGAKIWLNNANNSTHAGGEENYLVDSKEGCKPLGSLYQLSQSEVFSFKDKVEVNNNSTKINRRVNEKQFKKFEKLKEDNFGFVEALLKAKK
jgi:hypothetical protein